MARKIRESRARFIHEPLQSKRKFDPRSFRTVVRRAHRITFGCPKGKWSPTIGECKVPVQIQKILHPMAEAMLSNPCPISKNPIPRLGTGYAKKGFTVEDYDIITERLARITPGKKIRYGGKEWKIGPETFDLYYKSFGPLVHRGWTKFSLEGIRKRKNPRRDITIEKEAAKNRAKLSSFGYTEDEIKRMSPIKLQRRVDFHEGRMKPKKKYNLSTDMARYFARRAGAVTRGARKYVAPSVERAVYPVMLNPKTKVYVGAKLRGGYEVFRSSSKPTRRSHGQKYRFAAGPFRNLSRAQAYVNSMLGV